MANETNVGRAGNKLIELAQEASLEAGARVVEIVDDEASIKNNEVRLVIVNAKGQKVIIPFMSVNLEEGDETVRRQLVAKIRRGASE